MTIIQMPNADALAAAKRAGVKLARSEFCTACYRAGILTKEESVAAAKGDLPAPFSAVLAASVAAGDMTQAEADEAEILWASLAEVERNHPLIEIAKPAFSLDDAAVDVLFGIS